jgi:hypothetical protein
MSGDYSRQRFGPFKDYSEVLMQQGRVQLDADWNELVDIVDRRMRAETVDTIGLATVPKQTPDGFRIEITGGGAAIGPGRIYVDGLLAENHGKPRNADPRLDFDSVLAELRGSDPMPYAEQPYFPNVSNVAPFPTDGGPHLVYLDVWRREVTYLEDPDLVEKAVGVDSTTRSQTVWQVRVLQDVGAGATCATPDGDVKGWLDLVSSSAGRLTTAAVGVPQDDDPCLTPPSGGFRGLENRLYRVEIHDKGAQGTATFKWSRDDASVATAVTAIPDLHNLVVARVGRDAVLRFSAGDWIEITDDWRELAGEPGVMAHVQDVNDATRTLTLTDSLPAGVFAVNAQGETDSSRHTRIRRWDQKGQVSDTANHVLIDLDAAGSPGVIPVPPDGASIVLEDGVQITFSTTPAGGDYHTADYWTFAARTADASVEELQQAPPRGIHHHCCRLAMVTLPNDVTDCRTLWPPDFGEAGCDCTVCLTPEGGAQAIQRAIDQLKATGATICLGPGLYNLGRQPLHISAAQALRIKGHGWKTQLVYLGAGPAILVENSIDVTLEEMDILTSGRAISSGLAVAARNCARLTVQRCVLLQIGAGDTALPAVGLAGVMADVSIRENVILAAIGIGNIAIPGPNTTTGAAAAGSNALLTLGLVIRENFLICRERGVSLQGTVVHMGQTRIAANFVSDCAEAGIAALGITTAGAGVEIANNHVQARGSGIVAGSDGACITANAVTAPVQSPANAAAPVQPTGDGIVLTMVKGGTVDRCQVLNNRVTGVGGNGIAVQASLGSAMIKHNILENVGGGIVMADEASANVLDVEDNQLLNVAAVIDRSQDLAGIRVVRAAHAAVANNSLVGLGASAVDNPSCVGIQVIGPSTSCRISGNDVVDVGPPGDVIGDKVGVEYLGPFDRLDLAGNRVRRSENSPPDSIGSPWRAVRITAAPAAGGSATASGGATAAGRSLVAGQNVRFVTAGSLTFGVFGSKIARLPSGPGNLTVQGNQLDSYGQAETLLIVTSGACVFSNNQCVLLLAAGFPVASIEAGAIVASSNYMHGPGDVALALALPNEPPAYTVVGNIARGVIQVNGANLGTPWQPLNIITA